MNQTSGIKSRRNKAKNLVAQHNACRALINHIFFMNDTINGKTIRFVDRSSLFEKRAVFSHRNLQRAYNLALGDAGAIKAATSISGDGSFWGSLPLWNNAKNSPIVKLGYATYDKGTLSIRASVLPVVDNTFVPFKMLPKPKQEDKVLITTNDKSFVSVRPPVNAKELKSQIDSLIDQYIFVNHGDTIDKVKLFDEKIANTNKEIEKLVREVESLKSQRTAFQTEIDNARRELLQSL